MHLETADTGVIAAKTATAAIYAGSSGAIYFGLTANELGVFVGIAVAIAGFVVNVYYKHQHLKLARSRAGVVDDE